MSRRILLVIAVLFLGLAHAAAQPDLGDYRTVAKAKSATIAKADVVATRIPAFLGVSIGADAQSRLVVKDVAPNSPAARSGIKAGDIVLKLDGADVKDEQAFFDLIDRAAPGDKLKLELTRGKKTIDATPTLVPLSRPKLAGKQQAVLGINVVKAKEGDGVAVQGVAPGSPAEVTKLKIGDIILKADNVAVTGPEKLREILSSRKPDDVLTLLLGSAGKEIEMKVRLGAEQVVETPTKGFGKKGGFGKGKGGGEGGPNAGWDNRATGTWQKPTYRLAIVCVEYPDVKHNPTITSKAWEDSLFSTGTYIKTSVTGQQVFGSVNDVYREQSFGKLKIVGKCFDFVEVSKKRSDYATGNRMALFNEATDKLLARDGKDALKDFDGVFFLHAGGKVPNTPRGSLYWPHRGTFTYQGKRWPYFICSEGGQKMANISVFAHEFGHMLGLPDLYARPEVPGMEGLGIWSMMSNQAPNGRPQHFCAWSKEKMGWIQPTIIDPTVKQKIILAPIEDSPKECLKVLVRRDASEYLLLENRAKKGFDKSLPGEGLLIWRVVRNRPLLEESHGIEGPAGPGSFPASVPFPSPSNDSFTPFTTPSSRSHLGGGLPVYITNIRRLPDGKIALHIGYEYQ